MELVEGPDRLDVGAANACAGAAITSLIVEGGPTLHEAFWNAGLVDRVQIYVTPRDSGGDGVGWLPFPVMSSPLIVDRSARLLGDDTLLEGYVHRAD